MTRKRVARLDGLRLVISGVRIARALEKLRSVPGATESGGTISVPATDPDAVRAFYDVISAYGYKRTNNVRGVARLHKSVQRGDVMALHDEPLPTGVRRVAKALVNKRG